MRRLGRNLFVGLASLGGALILAGAILWNVAPVGSESARGPMVDVTAACWLVALFVGLPLWAAGIRQEVRRSGR